MDTRDCAVKRVVACACIGCSIGWTGSCDELFFPNWSRRTDGRLRYNVFEDERGADYRERGIARSTRGLNLSQEAEKVGSVSSVDNVAMSGCGWK